MSVAKILKAFALILLLTAGAEARIFTSTDGRTVDAEIAGIIKETVYLRLATGGVQGVLIEKFSPEDRTYIAEWELKQKKRLPPTVQVNLQKKTEKTDKSSRGERVTYTIVFRNTSRRAIDGVEVATSVELETKTTGGILGHTIRNVSRSSEFLKVGRMEVDEEKVFILKPLYIDTKVTTESITHRDLTTLRNITEVYSKKEEVRIKSIEASVFAEDKLIIKK